VSLMAMPILRRASDQLGFDSIGYVSVESSTARWNRSDAIPTRSDNLWKLMRASVQQKAGIYKLCLK